MFIIGLNFASEIHFDTNDFDLNDPLTDSPCNALKRKLCLPIKQGCPPPARR